LQTNQFTANGTLRGQFNLVTKLERITSTVPAYEYFQNRDLNSMDNLTKQAIAAHTIAGQPPMTTIVSAQYRWTDS